MMGSSICISFVCIVAWEKREPWKGIMHRKVAQGTWSCNDDLLILAASTALDTCKVSK